jgi:protein-S-isoprenylcysteine O-methyltransferase Ste14
MLIIKLIIFIVGTIVIVWVSRASLRDPRSHGFYRFFAWETILILLLLNVNYWFVDPFSPNQITAWTLLIISFVLIISGVGAFQRRGDIDSQRDDPTLVGIEKTTQLVTSGVYAYIRHPFYSSLLFLTWGIYLKHLSWLGIFLAMLATAFLTLTAKIEETENIEFFGEAYEEYMTRTKMFIPFIL